MIGMRSKKTKEIENELKPRAMKSPIQSRLLTKWDKRFCDLAKFVSKWSKDPNAKVGAVIVSRRGGDVSIGYNGFPMGVEDSLERLQSKKMKLDLIVHAEVNAIIAAGSRSERATLYVWGKPVCARCAGPIIQAGIARVVALNPESEKSTRWRALGKKAVAMFKEAEVEVDFYAVKNEK